METRLKLNSLTWVLLAVTMVACSSPPPRGPWVLYGFAFTDSSDSVAIRVKINGEVTNPEMQLDQTWLTPVPLRSPRIGPDSSFIEFVWPERAFDDCRLRRRAAREWVGACRSDAGERVIALGGLPRGDMGEHLPPSAVDLSIIDQAIERLSAPESWNQADDRICDHADIAGRVSLFCALYEASIDITGSYLHGRPAIEFPRYIIRETAIDRVTAHALRDYNNDARTTHAEILQLLRDARARLARGLDTAETTVE